jgi:fructose-1,6-bisphosphatase II / sedoheptulose-1,7-bisphosphatase
MSSKPGRPALGSAHAPDAVGPGYPKGVVDLDAPAEDNLVNLAKAKGVKPEAITAMILDRPRYADLIGAVRKAGAAVSLISDGRWIRAEHRQLGKFR